MRMKRSAIVLQTRRRNLCWAATACLAVVSLLLGPTIAAGMIYPPTTGEHRLTEYQRISGPDISGRWVVYRNNRGIAYAHYVLNLATGKSWQMTHWVHMNYGVGSPFVSGTKAVYSDRRPGTSADLYCYDIATRKETRLTQDPADEIALAFADGRRVVFRKQFDDHADLYCRDLLTKTTRLLVHDAGHEADISGANVVYTVGSTYGGGSKVYRYNLDTRKSRYVGDGSSPRISGTKIVWVSQHESATTPGAGLNKIRWLDLATGATRVLRTFDVAELYMEQSRVTISGRRVFYSSPSGGSMYCYYADTRRERLLRRVNAQVSAASGSMVIYTVSGGRSGYADAYVFETKPAAALGTPVAPTTMYGTKTYTVYGALKPRHKAGTSVGRLQCYIYYQGGWHPGRAFGLTAYDYSTYSRYRTKSVRLPYPGWWRMRVWHACSKHASSFSRWQYVVAK